MEESSDKKEAGEKSNADKATRSEKIKIKQASGSEEFRPAKKDAKAQSGQAGTKTERNGLAAKVMKSLVTKSLSGRVKVGPNDSSVKNKTPKEEQTKRPQG